nr:MAG TPA: hypothetical protein [Caudoviricetes sp.]
MCKPCFFSAMFYSVHFLTPFYKVCLYYKLTL